MRATRGLFQTLGVSGSMLAAAACSLLLVSTLVAFQGWPEVEGVDLAPASLIVSSPEADSGPGSSVTRVADSASPVVLGAATASSATVQRGARDSGVAQGSTGLPTATDVVGNSGTATPVGADPVSAAPEPATAPSAQAAPAQDPGAVVTDVAGQVDEAVRGVTGTGVVPAAADPGGSRQAGSAVDGLLGTRTP